MRPWQTSAISAIFLLTSIINVFASQPKRQRRKGRRRKLEPILSTKLNNADRESLRDRWVDILHSSYDASNAIRLETREEEEFYYSAEILADKLLTGLDEDSTNYLIARKRMTSNSFMPNVWESIAKGSTGILAIFPIAMFFLEILPPSFFSSYLNFLTNQITSINSSITPYLIPTVQTIQSSINDQLIQAQSIIASLPYLLRHIRRIQLVPLAIKLIRKCIILEAWRHIWIRLYKISKRVWQGTRVGSVKVYTKFVPAWIRRGLNSMFKSMVQAQVHGVVGSAIGGIYVDFMGGAGYAVSEIPIDESLEGALETTVDVSVDLVDAVESAVESGAVINLAESISDAISDSLSAAVEESLESAAGAISDSLDSAVDSLFDGTTIE